MLWCRSVLKLILRRTTNLVLLPGMTETTTLRPAFLGNTYLTPSSFCNTNLTPKTSRIPNLPSINFITPVRYYKLSDVGYGRNRLCGLLAHYTMENCSSQLDNRRTQLDNVKFYHLFGHPTGVTSWVVWQDSWAVTSTVEAVPWTPTRSYGSYGSYRVL